MSAPIRATRTLPWWRCSRDRDREERRQGLTEGPPYLRRLRGL